MKKSIEYLEHFQIAQAKDTRSHIWLKSNIFKRKTTAMINQYLLSEWGYEGMLVKH